MTNRKIRSLAKQIENLGPWHHVLDVRDGLTTKIERITNSDGKKISAIDPRLPFQRIMDKIYPQGLVGKSFLDHACNCGGYSFIAKEMGADRTYGYDVREKWIEQAEFLRANRSADTNNMTFEVLNLHELDRAQPDMFDISWFSGIFYHLPDPVAGLKIAADKTKEIFYLNTAILTHDEGEYHNGCLYLTKEGTTHAMTGVDGLAWVPSGPNVLINILNWLGFPETRIIHWRKRVVKNTRGDKRRDNIGRIAIVAARDKAMLTNVKDVEPVERAQHLWQRPD